METQARICPLCFDDHSEGRECNPGFVDKFSPSPDDNSYIAQEFRKLESKVAWMESMLERAEEFAVFGIRAAASDDAHEWLADLPHECRFQAKAARQTLSELQSDGGVV
jgi:uncharacterized protein CbrC (UPF0167 family)